MAVASCGPEEYVRASVDGVELSGLLHQHSNYLRELCAGQKESYAAELFRASVRPGAVVVDGGAYVGYYALVAARRAGSRGRVFAFEPHPHSFRSLQINLRANGYADRVSARPECLSDRIGIRRFHLAAGDGSESSMFVPEQPAGSPAVVCTTLDAALGHDLRVDVVKLDVEGGEIEALRGMRRTLAGSPTVVLFVECNPRALRRAGYRATALLEELERAGLTPRRIDEGERRLGPREDPEALVERAMEEGHVNLLCRRPLAS